MTSSYEQRIVEAMLRRSEALEQGDEQAAAEELVAAGRVADLLRSKRTFDDEREERARRETEGELEVVKP